MTHYHLPTQTARSPRGCERRTDTGQWVSPQNRAWTDDLAALCGFAPIVDTPRPDDTTTHTHDRTLALVGDVPTVTWVQRAKTADEVAAATTQANRATIEGRAATLIAQMDAITATTGTLTAAQLSGAVRQIAAGLRGITRLTVNLLDSAD